MMDEVLKNPWVRAAGVVVALALVLLLLYLLTPVLVPLFFAFLVAYVLDPVVDIFEKRKISRAITIACLAMLGIGMLLAVPLYFLPSMVMQADSLIEAAGKGFEDDGQVATWFRTNVERLPLESIIEAMGCASENSTAASDLAVLTECLAVRVREQALSFFQAHGATLATAGAEAGIGLAQFVSAIGSTLVGWLLFLGNLALFAFVAAYLLKDYDGIITAAKDLIPVKRREKIIEIMSKVDAQIRSFLRGQMLVCLGLGILYAIGLSIAGVPFALLIAAFGAVASFIPYLGLALTIGPAITLCLVQHGGIDWHVGAVVGTFVVAQMIEGMILTPMVVGDKVGLSPVWVILAILVFGNALGFLGLLLAVPIAAALKVFVVEGLAYYKASEAYTDT